MRISTSWIYSSGLAAMGAKQADMLHTQQQLSSGRRVLTPADDPTAASNALTSEQARAAAEQYVRNQGFARSTLALAESTLAQVGDLLQDARALGVAAGNGALGASDRASLALDLRGKIDTLLSLANTRDGDAGFLFSGYQQGVQAFAPTGAGIAYQGDQGSRALQVSAQRRLEVSASGAEIFAGARAGNGSFVVSPGATNGGAAAADAGRVLNPAALTGDSFQVRFHVAGATTTYDVIDTTTAATLVSGAAYAPGTAIGFAGMQVTFTGAPADNDAFDIAPSARQSVFRTLEDLAALLDASAQGMVGQGAYRTRLQSALAAIDGAHDQVLAVRTGIGSRLRELDALGAQSDDQIESRQAEHSRLVDLDYADAISRLSLQQTALQAAQQSYLRVTALSLFNFL